MPSLIPALLVRGSIDEQDVARLPAELRSLQTVEPAQWLVDHHFLSPYAFAKTLAHQLGIPYVDLSRTTLNREAVQLLPGPLCRRLNVIPVDFTDEGRLVLGMLDPGDLRAIDDVSMATQREVSPVTVSQPDLQDALNKFHRSDAELSELSSKLTTQAEESEDVQVDEDAAESESPLIKFTNLLIRQAIHDNASDIHIEPREFDVSVRYRVDGVLHEMQSPPKALQNGLVSRLKIMAGLDIAERRKPQDGRVSVTFDGRSVDLRVATLPTVWGENVVLRVLDHRNTLELRDLEFSPENLSRFQEAYRRPYGMVLATGPTGAGKSATLHAVLDDILSPEINVIAVEDPVEFRMAGVNQVQVNQKAGLTFASALRAILRSDPDVVIIGEIRDHETARIAVDAAMTGHLVLATLHTNDAPSAMTRLTEMGVEPFLVSSAVVGVVAQRLVRRLCESCRKPMSMSAAAARDAGFTLPDGQESATVYVPVGCSRCENRGYLGRVAVHEVLTANGHLHRLIAQNAPAEQIGAQAVADGMVPMREDCWRKVLRGVTSLAELYRVLG
jgi:type IV pilus assembly protein PilB